MNTGWTRTRMDTETKKNVRATYCIETRKLEIKIIIINMFDTFLILILTNTVNYVWNS